MSALTDPPPPTPDPPASSVLADTTDVINKLRLGEALSIPDATLAQALRMSRVLIGGLGEDPDVGFSEQTTIDFSPDSKVYKQLQTLSETLGHMQMGNINHMWLQQSLQQDNDMTAWLRSGALGLAFACNIATYSMADPYVLRIQSRVPELLRDRLSVLFSRLALTTTPSGKSNILFVQHRFQGDEGKPNPIVVPAGYKQPLFSFDPRQQSRVPGVDKLFELCNAPTTEHPVFVVANTQVFTDATFLNVLKTLVKLLIRREGVPFCVLFFGDYVQPHCDVHNTLQRTVINTCQTTTNNFYDGDKYLARGGKTVYQKDFEVLDDLNSGNYSYLRNPRQDVFRRILYNLANPRLCRNIAHTALNTYTDREFWRFGGGSVLAVFLWLGPIRDPQDRGRSIQLEFVFYGREAMSHGLIRGVHNRHDRELIGEKVIEENGEELEKQREKTDSNPCYTVTWPLWDVDPQCRFGNQPCNVEVLITRNHPLTTYEVQQRTFVYVMCVLLCSMPHVERVSVHVEDGAEFEWVPFVNEEHFQGDNRRGVQMNEVLEATRALCSCTRPEHSDRGKVPPDQPPEPEEEEEIMETENVYNIVAFSQFNRHPFYRSLRRRQSTLKAHDEGMK